MQPSHASSNTPEGAPRHAVARTIKITALYRVSGRRRRECRVPFIRMSGKWLASLGFNSYSHVVIRGQPGQLTLTLLSHNNAATAEGGLTSR
jgi:hypothetical protein